MKNKLILLLAILALCKFSSAQIESTGNDNRPQAYKDREYFNHFRFQGGHFAPFGNLSKHLGSGYCFGAQLTTPMMEQSYFGIRMSGSISTTDKTFKYHRSGNVYNAQSSGTVFLGLIVGKEQHIKKHFIFDRSIGLGISHLGTDVQKNKPSENDSTYSLVMPGLMLGSSFDFFVFKKKTIGVFAEVTMTPWTLFGRVKSGFGFAYLHYGVRIKL